MLAVISIFAAAVVAFLGWQLFRRLQSDSLLALTEKRRPSARLVSRGEYVDGSRHLDVALAVTSSTLFYENADMQASLDLEWIREVEYATELVTGARIDSGKVMRLRSDRQTFEFVIPENSVSRWLDVLPPHVRASATAAVQA